MRPGGGGLAGAWYGIGETFFTALLSPALGRLAGDFYTPLAPVTTLVFLLSYPVLGALVGVALWLLLSRIPFLRSACRGEHAKDFFGLATLCVVLLLLLANVLGAGHRGPSAALSIGLPGALGLVGLIRCANPRVRTVTAPLAPFLGSGHIAWLLTGLLWITLYHYAHEPNGVLDKLRGAGLLVAAGAVGAIVRQRLITSTSGGRGRGSGSARVTLIGAFVCLCALLIEYPAAPEIPTPAEAEIRGKGTPVVLIVLDTLRADHLDLYGYERETAPNLRRFARTATRSDRATTSASYTLTGHASLFTGLFPSHNGSDAGRLPSDATTLAEHLGLAGYDTWAVVANYGFLGRGYGLGQGFDFYDARPGRALFRRPSPVFLRQPITTYIRESFFPHLNAWNFRSAAEINAATLPVVDEITRRDRPFLLFLNYMDVHRPISLSAEWRDRFPGRDPNFDWSIEWQVLQDAVEEDGRRVSEREEANLTSQSDGAIAYLDSHIGLLLDDLKERDLFDRSLIIVTSDHGEAFGEKSTFGHGRSLYEGVARACLLIKYPAQTRPEVESRPTGVVDVLPTILASLGLPAQVGLDGLDLTGSGLSAERVLMAEAFDETFNPEHPPFRALYSGRDKLIAWPNGRRELYALAEDPLEEDDRSTRDPDTVRRLEASLKETIERNAYRPAGARETVDERDRERLRSLGYVR